MQQLPGNPQKRGSQNNMQEQEAQTKTKIIVF